jgi:hypothetical protein
MLKPFNTEARHWTHCTGSNPNGELLSLLFLRLRQTVSQSNSGP